MAPQHSHHESGNGQNEIDCRYAGPLKTADNVMTFKQIVRAIAMRNGLPTLSVCSTIGVASLAIH